MKKELLLAIKSGNTRKFYTSRTWRNKRKKILERDNHECQHCKRKGKYHVAESVHHKKHLREHPELALVDSNLISLCNVHHNMEHPEKMIEYKEPKKKFFIEERWE